MVVAALCTELPRASLAMAMEVMVMVDIMVRGLLMPSQDMLLDIPTEPHRVLLAMVVTDMEVMAMVVIMARDLLSLDTMVEPALLSTRAVLTTMDLMAMVSTTMAREQLMLDIMDMVWLAAFSK